MYYLPLGIPTHLIHKKFSIPAACVIFALLGAPLGAIIRRRGAAVSVGTSLAFFWIYWMFLIGGEELADRQLISAYTAMWSANVILGVVGVFLLARTNSEQVLINSRWFIGFIPARWRRRIMRFFNPTSTSNDD